MSDEELWAEAERLAAIQAAPGILYDTTVEQQKFARLALAERERARKHATDLNTIGWSVAMALGDIEDPESGEHFGHPVADVARLIHDRKELIARCEQSNGDNLRYAENAAKATRERDEAVRIRDQYQRRLKESGERNLTLNAQALREAAREAEVARLRRLAKELTEARAERDRWQRRHDQTEEWWRKARLEARDYRRERDAASLHESEADRKLQQAEAEVEDLRPEVERLARERDEARAEVGRLREVLTAAPSCEAQGTCRALAERDGLRAAVAVLIERPSIITVTGATVDAVFKDELRALVADPDAALRQRDGQKVNEGIRLAAHLVRDHVLGETGKKVAAFIEKRAARSEGGRCTCANDGNASRCPHHTQEDFDAADRARHAGCDHGSVYGYCEEATDD